MVGADASAVGIFHNRPLSSPEWVVDGLPSTFFETYDQLAAEDFVRDAVVVRPSVVLRDHQMIDRRGLERHALYRHARDVGAPLEQVMAVMVVVGAEGASGLALYRDRRRPFSARERATLQSVTPAFTRAIHHCLLHSRVRSKAAAFDALGAGGRLATALVSGRDMACAPAAEAIVSRWFSSSERVEGAVPAPLASFLADRSAWPAGPAVWRRRCADRVLEVSFLPLPESRGPDWLLSFEERHRPSWCATLTPRERQVLRGLVDRWDNRLLADELRCSVETIKKHVSHILEKAGVDDRRAFANQQYDL